LSAATRGFPRVALVTCEELPDLDPDDQLLVEPLRSAGVTVAVHAWDAPGVDWVGYDLVVLRSTWDYVPRRDEFLAWARGIPALANPARVVEWNTDKRYLAGLAAAGIPVVPTQYLTPADPPWMPPAHGEYVLKPAIGVGSLSAGRYNLADPDQRALALRHAARFRATRRVALVQPYLTGVDGYGETAVLFLGGRFSHGVRKGPMLDGPAGGAPGLYRAEQISAREPNPAEFAVAEKVLAAIPDASHLLYARVDLVPGPDGAPVLIELELTEPSLYLGYAPGAPTRLAEAIVARLAESGSGGAGRPG
jgi:glutathione synthase/RimK-type ligase-like ATP-grasp enzyme